MTDNPEGRTDDELRALLLGAAREGGLTALREFALTVLQIDPDKPDEVRTWQADLHFAHRMRKLSERGRMIFFTVAATAISAWIISQIWSSFASTVKKTLPP